MIVAHCVMVVFAWGFSSSASLKDIGVYRAPMFWRVGARWTTRFPFMWRSFTTLIPTFSWSSSGSAHFICT